MSTTSPMTLDDLTDTLATANPALVLLRGFDSPHGSRATNFHPALGFEPARRITISAMLAAARSAKGTKVISRGGEFTVTGNTPCWLDFTGMTAGLEITPELLADYIAAGSVPSPPGAQGAPLSTGDFYQPGYTYAAIGTDWRFRCDAIITHPGTGDRTAIGWRHFDGEWEVYAYGEGDWGVAQMEKALLGRTAVLSKNGPVAETEAIAATSQLAPVTTPLDAPTRRVHLMEAADAITRLQDQMDEEIRTEYGELDRDTEVEGAATRRMADMLRELAGTAAPEQPASTPAVLAPIMPPTPFNPDDPGAYYEVEIDEEGPVVHSECCHDRIGAPTARLFHEALGRWLAIQPRRPS
ncbi:hypothetical protein [Streptomyces bacillaris]|uniref:hypothetical protein n=1 Tax=Streptomyces bacillaris TaxID=68179 RepID=UPI00363E0534